MLLNQKVEIPLTLPIETFHVAARVARVHARCGRLVLIPSKLFQVLRGQSRTGRERVVSAKTGPEGLAVTLALLKVELGLEEGAWFEVKVVREWVVQRALDARLVGVVGAFEGRWGAGEDGGAVQDDCGVEIWTWGRRLWWGGHLGC